MSESESVSRSSKEKKPADDVFTSHFVQDPAPSKWPNYVLTVLLILTGTGFAVVSYLNSKLSDEISSLNTNQAEVANLDPMVKLAPIPAVGSIPTKTKDPGEVEEVTKALGWLARKSLEEFRLTSPPKDNAYYYYVRLLEIDPDNKTARRGLKMIADKFANLAEKELAKNKYRSAAEYINIGLQVDAQNKRLKELRSLTAKSKQNIFDSLRKLFKS